MNLYVHVCQGCDTFILSTDINLIEKTMKDEILCPSCGAQLCSCQECVNWYFKEKEFNLLHY